MASARGVPGTEASLVHLTEAGRVALARTEGLRFRAPAALVQQLGGVEVARLRTTVTALGTALAAERPEATGDAAALGRALPLGA